MSWIYRRPSDFRAQLGRSLFALLYAASATSGTAAIALTATGTLAGSGALAGTCTISCSAQGATQGANLNGVSANTLTPVGTATAVGQVTGVAAVVFANSGTLTGAAAVPVHQRYKPARWRPQENWYSRQLDKLVIFPFSEPTGAIGQSDIIFTPTGTLRGTGVFAGVSSTTLTATGTLRGTGALLGSAALVFTPEGTITGTAAGDITGTAAISFGASGDLFGVGALAGLSSNAFTASLQTGSVQPLVGSAEIVFSVIGNLVDSQPPRRTPRFRTVYVNNKRRR